MAKQKSTELKEEMDLDLQELTGQPVLEGKLNEVIKVITKRPNGTTRIQQDFQFCPTMAEQHTAHLTDINYLIERHKPDELAAYIAARSQYRQEIIGHDFSKEPSLQEAKNLVYQSQVNYNNLPEDIKKHFRNHVEFLKFVDNPANAEKMVKLGLLTKQEIKDLQSLEPVITPTPTPTRTQDEEKAKAK